MAFVLDILLRAKTSVYRVYRRTSGKNIRLLTLVIMVLAGVQLYRLKSRTFAESHYQSKQKRSNTIFSKPQDPTVRLIHDRKDFNSPNKNESLNQSKKKRGNTIFTKPPGTKFPCTETFNKTFEDNLRFIQNYPVGVAEPYLRDLGVFNKAPTKIRDFPVFVSAFDESHFNESQGLFKSIHETFLASKKYKDKLLIIVYDLGLTKEQVITLKRNCKCEVRPFPFDNVPAHVKTLKTYAFKPIIVQKLLIEFGFVWWVDTSVRFTTNDIELILTKAKTRGLLFTVSINYAAVGTLTKHTFNATFDFLKEDRCKFKSFHEIWATTLMFYSDSVTNIVVQAWVTCALNQPCIAPEGSSWKRGCNFLKNYDGRCHRFDQSVLGIILRRLFNEQDYPQERILPAYLYKIKRRDIVPYFK